MDKKDIIQYWLDSADIDFKAMNHLFEKGDYSWSLFVGHLFIEKLLQACYVTYVDESVPKYTTCYALLKM